MYAWLYIYHDRYTFVIASLAQIDIFIQPFIAIDCNGRSRLRRLDIPIYYLDCTIGTVSIFSFSVICPYRPL